MVAMLKIPSILRLPVEAVQPKPQCAKAGAERRVFPRKELSIGVQGVRIDNTIPARRQPHLNLSLRDISVGGLSAISPTELQSGERLSIVFPPESNRMGWDAYGRVVRCEPSTLGYRVALEFDLLQAA
jgi:hypothetical protein